MLAGFGNAALHRIDEVEVRPVANSGLGIGCQVRRVENANGGFERESTARQIRVKACLFGIWLVAIPAATGGIEDFTIGNIAGMGRDGRGRQRPRGAHQPKSSEAQHCEQCQTPEVSFG